MEARQFLFGIANPRLGSKKLTARSLFNIAVRSVVSTSARMGEVALAEVVGLLVAETVEVEEANGAKEMDEVVAVDAVDEVNEVDEVAKDEPLLDEVDKAVARDECVGLLVRSTGTG
jgi:hypothetical protein